MSKALRKIVPKTQGGRQYLPFVFTEQGIAMLSTVLNSEQAILVNIVIMRIFVRIKEVLSSHQPLLKRIEKIEAKVSQHDHQLKELFNTLKEMISAAAKRCVEKFEGIPTLQSAESV